MSIWIAGAAVLVFLALSSVWKYSFLAIFVLLFLGSELMGSTTWVARPHADETAKCAPCVHLLYNRHAVVRIRIRAVSHKR